MAIWKFIKSLQRMTFSGFSYGPFTPAIFGRLPGSAQDFSGRAGELWLNGVVSVALRWLADNFTEPDLVVERILSDGRSKPVIGHPMLKLLDNPNPAYDCITLFQALLLSYLTDGNAYARKIRNGMGEVVQLWYLPHWEVRPIRVQETDFVSYYQRTNYTGQPIEDIPPQDIIHFRYGLDPFYQMLGLSPLKAQMREIVGDNAASTYSCAVMTNMGVIPYVLTPADPNATLDPEAVETFKERIRKNTGDNSADPIAFSGNVKVQQIGLTPEKLALDKIRDVPEDRICAALGVNAMTLGLTSGSNAKSYANYETAVAASYNGGLIPLQTRMAETLYRQLLPDFEEETSRFRIVWDYSRVKALQESQDSVVSRTTVLWTNDLITRATALSILGMEHDEAKDDIYHHQLGTGVTTSVTEPSAVVKSLTSEGDVEPEAS